MNYFTLAKDAVIVVAIGILLYMVYRAGEDRVHASTLNDLKKEMQEQTNILHGWREVSTHANEKLAADVAAINATPTVQHRWLCSQSSNSQPAVLPGAAGQAGTSDSAAGGFQPGSGVDADGARRDAILDAFKKRWETKLAEWRAEDAQWPK